MSGMQRLEEDTGSYYSFGRFSNVKVPFWVRRRSLLERFLLIVCFIAILMLLIFFGLYVNNRNNSDSSDNPETNGGSTAKKIIQESPAPNATYQRPEPVTSNSTTQSPGTPSPTARPPGTPSPTTRPPGTPSPTTRPPDSRPGRKCLTKRCIVSAGEMIQDMNTTVDPCQDFNLYACGGWSSRHTRGLTQREHTPIIHQQFLNNGKLLLILRSGVKRTSSTSYERKLKVLFRSCYSGLGTVGSSRFLQSVLNVGPEGVHLFGTFDSDHFNLNDQLKRVHGDFWTDVFFGIHIELDWKNSSNRNIQIHAAGRGINMLYYVDPNLSRIYGYYRKYMDKTLRLLIRDKGIKDSDTMNITQTVNTFIGDVMRIEIQLERLVYGSTKLAIHKQHLERVTLRQLTNDTGGFIDFVDVLSYMFNEAGVNEDTMVVAVDNDYLKPMAEFLSGLGANRSRIIHNYFTWRLIHKYTEHMSWEYIYAGHEFYTAVTGDKRMPSAEYSCYMRLTKHMSLALSAMFGKEHMDEEDKTYVKSILDHVEQAALKRIQTLQWMSDTTRLTAESKLKSIVTQIGTADFMDSDAAMDKIYERLHVTGHYLQDMINLDHFERADANAYLKSGNKRSLWGPWSTYRAGPFYMGALNEIIAPVGMFHQPLYRRGRASYNNFATTGMMLSYMVVHAYNEYGKNYMDGGGFEVSDDEEFISWWSNETNNAFLEAEKCVIDYYNNKTATLSVSGRPIQMRLTATSVDAVIDEQSAVLIAFEAMKSWEAENTVSDPLIGLDMTHDQLFFTAYAQMRCINTVDYSTYLRVMSGKLPWGMLVNGILGHTDEFTNAFNCPSGSPMNVEERCQKF